LEIEHPLDKYLRDGMIPHIWCEGCGNGIILNCFTKALQESELDTNKLVVVSGIGCIGRISGYINSDGFHTTHGRAIPFATGAKIANPSLNVVVISGDGDLFAIGGNHFIHAARRNIDIKVICSNNFNYGMTGGQSGPTTPLEAWTMTTPYGNIEHPLNLVHLASASGAVYVARWTVMHVTRLINSIKRSLKKKGFTFIEVVSPCPELFGRYNRMGDASEMLRWLSENSEIHHGYDTSKADIGLREKLILGEFVDIEKPEYTDLLNTVNLRVREALAKEGKPTLVRLEG